ncbi:MAG: type IV secretory system conjugative DNA transfer family protein [Pseudomonadota bacterium]|nr:type IV secretory system conjugative DNA transfer family protein [Pseudomonadota bacterium]
MKNSLTLSISLLASQAVWANSGSDELPVKVADKHVAACLVLGEECDQVFDPKLERDKRYSEEDKRIFHKLINVTSDQVKDAKSKQITALSDKTVEMSAKTLGEQTGFAVGIKRVGRVVTKVAPFLDATINKAFKQLMIYDELGRMIKPSIIDVSKDNISVNKTGKVFRAASQTFHIRSNARFVATPPTWRSYLNVEYSKPKLPSAGFLPSNDRQQKIWADGIMDGYSAGIQHALQVYSYKFNRIQSDIEGMVRYHTLRAYNMVSEPKLTKRKRTVVGGGNTMSIDEHILTIDVTPQLNSGVDRWKALPRLPDITTFNIAGDDYRYEGVKSLGE